jgi:hypothetical protein
MKQNSLTLPFPKVRLTSATLIDNVWVCVGGKALLCARMPPLREVEYHQM